MSASPYFKNLGSQPGAQIDIEPLAAFELSAVADRVAGTVARLSRGPIDRPFMVSRQDLELQTGEARSNLVLAIHEARMQMAEALDAGAAGVVVSRLVPSSTVKRYASVSLDGAVAMPPDLIESVQLIVDGNDILVMVTVVDMEGGSGADFDFVAPVTVSGIQASAYTLDVSQFFIDSGMSLSGGRVNVTAGTRNFTMELHITDDGYSGTVLVQVGNASDSGVIAGEVWE